jgi:hypothetical protein
VEREEIQMNKVVLGVLLCVISGMIPNTLNATDLNTTIIGEWNSIISGQDSVEFIKGGTIIMGKDVGDYSLVDEDRIRINLTPPRSPRVCKARIEYNVLSLSCNDETNLHYLKKQERKVNSAYIDRKPNLKLNDYYPMEIGIEREYRTYLSKDKSVKSAYKTKVFSAKKVSWLPANHHAAGKELIRLVVLQIDHDKSDQEQDKWFFRDTEIATLDYLSIQDNAIELCAQEKRYVPGTLEIDSEHQETDKWHFANNFVLKGPLELDSKWQREFKSGSKSGSKTMVSEYVIEKSHEDVQTPMGLFVGCIRLGVKSSASNVTGNLWYAPGFGLVKVQWPDRTDFLVKTSIE